ncbi:hypothetical protein EYF80_000763 [Liparis tanakae]|uniref:Uncharacterized protein n=1 Tax=Liparis tanakae TaxID=230148 RepID=A0A4Z2JF50_9TELE|nr:hypothetical protein EYF80_000763 [Liparis tanakae]
MASEGSLAHQGQLKDAGECCRIRACLSEGHAAKGEQKIAQLRETERQPGQSTVTCTFRYLVPLSAAAHLEERTGVTDEYE